MPKSSGKVRWNNAVGFGRCAFLICSVSLRDLIGDNARIAISASTTDAALATRHCRADVTDYIAHSGVALRVRPT